MGASCRGVQTVVNKGEGGRVGDSFQGERGCQQERGAINSLLTTIQGWFIKKKKWDSGGSGLLKKNLGLRW